MAYFSYRSDAHARTHTDSHAHTHTDTTHSSARFLIPSLCSLRVCVVVALAVASFIIPATFDPVAVKLVGALPHAHPHTPFSLARAYVYTRMHTPLLFPLTVLF